MRKVLIALVMGLAIVAGTAAPSSAAWTHHPRHFRDQCINIPGYQSPYWIASLRHHKVQRILGYCVVIPWHWHQ